jgi:hypothetical protein
MDLACKGGVHEYQALEALTGSQLRRLRSFVERGTPGAAAKHKEGHDRAERSSVTDGLFLTRTRDRLNHGASLRMRNTTDGAIMIVARKAPNQVVHGGKDFKEFQGSTRLQYNTGVF